MNMNMEPVKILYPHSLGNYIILKIGERYLEQANILQEKLQNCSCQFTDNTRFVPRINQTVAIYSAQNRKWNRAQVLKVNCEERECLVRYLEVATTDTVTFLSMHPVPRDMSVEAIPPQSIQITLADVCPVMVNFLGEVQPGSQWTHLSLDEIREYFGKHRGFFYEHKYTIQGFHFGNLHVRRSNGSVDLANELVQSGHALRYQNWLEQTRRLPPIALEHLTGGLKMCSREMLMKLKESRRVHTRSSSVSSDDRLARSSHRPTTGQPRTNQPQESVVSSTTDQVRGDPSARSAGDTPLSRRSRSLIRPRDAGPGSRGSEGGAGSEGGVGSEGGAGSVQRDAGRRDEPIRWTDGEPTGRSENGITSPPALAPHVMEALASVEPHPGRRKSRLTLLLEKVKAKKGAREGGGVTHGSCDERNVSTSPLQNGTGAVHHNGDMPNGGTPIGGMATPNTKQTTDRTTPVTCPAASGQSLSQGARNLMNRMTKSGGQISPGYNVTAVNTNRPSLPQRETAGGIAPCNATQSTISQPSAGERTSLNATPSPISPQLSDGGMTSTNVTQSPVSPNNSPVSPQPDGRNSRRLSRRDIFRKVQKMKTNSVLNTSASVISASAVDNAGPVCPTSTISGTYPVRNADFRTDTVCHTNLNDGSPNRSLNVSSADSSLNVSYTDLSVTGSYTDSSVNVISTDSNVNGTLKSAVSRGRSQSRASEQPPTSEPSSLPLASILPQPEESYLNVCRPVTHSKLPLQCTGPVLGVESRLHHSIVENSHFPLVSVAQMSTVPAILQRRNLCVVHTLKSQYNSSYLGSLLSLLIEKKSNYFYKRSFEVEPLVLILAPNSRICEELYSATSCFIDKFCDVTVKTIYGSSPDNEKHALFSAVNGCDILITTPRCLDRLKESKIVGLSWVYHYVLERADILFEKFSKEVSTFLGYLQVISKARQEKKASSTLLCPDLQIILSSETYTRPVENFLRNKMTQPVLVLSNFLEAAIYGQVDFSLSIVLQQETKLSYLLEILQKYSNCNEKIAILCASLSDVRLVTDHLSSIYPNLFPVHSSVNIIDTHRYMSRWKCLGKQGELPILISDDEAMCNIFVEDVTVLIHYSLPLSKSAMSRRFKLLKSALVNLFEDHDGQVQCGRSHLILDESNDIQFFDLITLAKRLRLDVPCRVLEQAKAFRLAREGEKRAMPLCPQLLMFGQCHLTPSCGYRHAFVPALDAPAPHLPKQGRIKFTVLSVLDGSCFTARIFHTQAAPGGEWRPHRDHAATIHLALRRVYGTRRDARVTHYNPAPGDVVVVERRNNGQLTRARVVEMIRRGGGGERGEVSGVRVRFCDAAGPLTEYPVSKLFVLPPELKKYPDQVVLVFATRVLPIDEDIHWNRDTCHFLESLVQEHMRGEHENYFVGRIVLALNNTYLLDPFQCCQYLSSSSVEICHFSVRHSLLTTRRALPYPAHLGQLYEQCAHIPGSVPEYMRDKAQEVLPVSPFAELPAPKWAILSQGELNECTLVGIVDPGLFFLQRNQFQDVLRRLNHEIQTDVGRTTSRYYREQCGPGLLCLARSDDNSGYNRGQVTNTEDPHVAMVLFVDYSDKQDILYEDLVPIHRPQLISNLPFQAIECCLAGVEPAEEKWSRAAYDFLDDFSHLFARVVSVKLQGVETGGRQYAVELFELEERVNLNKQLVVLGLAKYTEEATVVLTQDDEAVFTEIEKLMRSAEDDGDFEEWEDLEDKKEFLSQRETSKVVATSKNHADDLVINEAALLEEDLTGFLEQLDPDFLSEQKQMVEKIVGTHTQPALPSSSSPLCDGARGTSSPNTTEELSSVANKSLGQSNSSGSADFNSHSASSKTSTSHKSVGGVSDPQDTGVKLTPLPDDMDPAMPPLTVHSYPARVQWYQRGEHVFVHMHLPGLHEDFMLNVEEKFVHFYIEIEGRRYENQLPLLCYVTPGESSCEWNGFEIRLKLAKQMRSLEWPFLLEDGIDKSVTWLSYHVDHLCDNEDVVSSEDEDMEPGPPTDGVKGIRGRTTLSSEDEDPEAENNATCHVPEDL